MARQHVYPSAHWSLKVPIPYSMGIKTADFIVLAGQVDMKGNGQVQSPGNLDAQTKVSLGHVTRILGELGADNRDIAKLVVFYKQDGSVDEDAYRARIGQWLGVTDAQITIGFVPLKELAYPGMMVEIDTYAFRGRDGKRVPKVAAALPEFEDLGRPFAPAIRVGDMIFTSGIKARDRAGRVLHSGDTVAQARVVQENLRKALAALGAEPGDVVKLNTWYVAGGTVEEWEKNAKLRAAFFPDPGPSATGVPLHAMAPSGVRFQMDAWAMRGADGSKPARKHIWLENHWNWPKVKMPFKHGLQVGKLVFVSGQPALDTKGTVLAPNDMKAQAKICMDNVGKVLAKAGLKHKDILKVNCYYRGTDNPDHLHDNVNVRSSYFKKPGPTSTGVPVATLAYDGMMVEIEAIASVE
jgi:enamine deaminase RidA (YjgF/YER057c/UK114 family)